MNSFVIIFLIIFFSIQGVKAQETHQSRDSSRIEEQIIEDQFDEDVAVPDTTLIISVNNIPADTIKALKNMKQFAYVQSMDRLLKQKQQEQQKNMRTAGKSISLLDRLFNSSFLKIIAWLIVGIIVTFLLIKFINTRGLFIKNKSGTKVVEGEEDVSAAVHTDYVKMIQQSVSAGDYRSAVKFNFLKTLQLLSEYSFINYSADKTNFMYLQEIGNDKKKEFLRLVSHYEYIWYGTADIERETYYKIETYFTLFNKKI